MKANCRICQRPLMRQRDIGQGRCIDHSTDAKIMHGMIWSKNACIMRAIRDSDMYTKVTVGEWARECDSAWERDDIQELNRLRTLARYTPKEATQ